MSQVQRVAKAIYDVDRAWGADASGPSNPYYEGMASAAIKAAGTDSLQDFARWVIENSSFSGTDLCGGDVQEKATELGLLKMVMYDPEVHGENDVDAEPGDPWFEFTELLKND